MTGHGGDAVRRARGLKGWGVRKLARESELSPTYVSQIENGKRPPTARALARIAKAVGIPSYELMVDAGVIPREQLRRAVDLAERAVAGLPPVEAPFAEAKEAEQFERRVIDCLRALGYDPEGVAADGHTVHPTNDWRGLEPTALAPVREHRSQMLADYLAESLARPASRLEGWDELNETDRATVQEMVNELRRSAADEQPKRHSPEGR